jgi:hypothetical protein
MAKSKSSSSRRGSSSSKGSSSRGGSSSSRRGSSSSGRGGSTARSAASTTDHEEIRRWAEERNGKPACVKGTRGGNSCLLRIDFPGGAGSESLEEMSWDDFFNVLDERGLVFLYQKGNSTFNKLVTPDSIEKKSKGKGGGSSRGRGGAAQKSGAPHGRAAD